jgi:hypothetical protein
VREFHSESDQLEVSKAAPSMRFNLDDRTAHHISSKNDKRNWENLPDPYTEKTSIAYKFIVVTMTHADGKRKNVSVRL